MKQCKDMEKPLEESNYFVSLTRILKQLGFWLRGFEPRSSFVTKAPLFVMVFLNCSHPLSPCGIHRTYLLGPTSKLAKV